MTPSEIRAKIEDLKIRRYHAIQAENWALAGDLQEQIVRLEALL